MMQEGRNDRQRHRLLRTEHRRDDRLFAEEQINIDRLCHNILNACELDTIGDITMVVSALEQASMALLTITCPQYRSGWFARRLPFLVHWANQLADAQGYCTISRGDAICEPENEEASS
jgi:hypothetical protein